MRGARLLPCLCRKATSTGTSADLQAAIGRRHKASTAPGNKLQQDWSNDLTQRVTSVSDVTPVSSATSFSSVKGRQLGGEEGDSSRSTAYYSHEAVVGVSTTVPHVEDSIASPPTHEPFGSPRPFSEMPAISTIWMGLPGGVLHGLTFDERSAILQEMFGPIFSERFFGGFRMVHLYRPEDMEAVYRSQGNKPERNSFNLLRVYNELYNEGVQGILTSQGDAWHRLRSQSQVQMLKPKSAAAYLDLHNQVADDLLACVQRERDPQGVVHDLLPTLYKFAMEAIGSVCFNRRLGALEADLPTDSSASRFIRAVGDVMEGVQSEMLLSTQLFLMFPKFIRGSSMFRKFCRAQNFIKQLSTEEALRTLQLLEQGQRSEEEEKADLIPYLMTRTDLSQEQVLTLISEFFFAGVDTTSHMVGFCLYLLSRHPDKQEQLVREIQEHVSGSDVITASMLGRMSYLKAVMKESVRLLPITPGNGRTLTTDVVLSGYHVPAGVMVGLRHDWAGRSPLYVHHPDQFLPERWVRGHPAAHPAIHPFVLMPFGFGARGCVGRRFAEQEFFLALIKVLQKYRVEYAHNEDLRYQMKIVNTPVTPLKFRFLPRQ